MFHTIQSLRHHIRTVHGVSDLTFGTDNPATPPQGICQGNGAGPAIWAVVSTPILDMLCAEGFGIKFVSPLSGVSIHFAAYVFVDNCDMCKTATHPAIPIHQLVQTMQQGLNL